LNHVINYQESKEHLRVPKIILLLSIIKEKLNNKLFKEMLKTIYLNCEYMNILNKKRGNVMIPRFQKLLLITELLIFVF